MKPEDDNTSQGEGDARRRARYGPRPTRVSVDELIAKGRTAIERVRPIVERTVDRLRARFARK